MAYVSPSLAAGINHISRTILGNFSGGPVVKNQPANAGDTGLIPAGKIPHGAGQLSLWAATVEDVF